MPAGQARTSVTVILGQGRRNAGRIGNGVGYDGYALRRSGLPWFGGGATVTPTRRQVPLTGRPTLTISDHEPARSATLAQFQANEHVVARSPREDGPFPSMYPDWPRGRYAWAMSVDLNSCIGCGVCTLACQAENNIPIVGAEQVRLGRAMHWIRVDTYHTEKPQQQEYAVRQPVPCMHCEHAPCELVCPVEATVHNSDGLNLQIYNRCIGTRWCSNNCPYKVRRFNFLEYSDYATESLKGQRNPEVTVRSRGVMEKCTYCVQRIRVAEIQADKDDRHLGDGEVRTACQDACPTNAIVFGDIQDPNSEVSHAKSSPLDYVLLAEENTRPRTTYSARLRNPHPRLDALQAAADAAGEAPA
jgi:molybdopterin-containing oxidoreductase family iron-sulfur binding subunit